MTISDDSSNEPKQVKPLRILDDTGYLTFKQLNTAQKEFVFSRSYMNVNIGGYQSGKTSAMACACWKDLLLFPGNRGWICRLTGSKLEDSTMKEFFDVIGTTARNCMDHPLVKHWNSQKRDLVLNNGSEVKFVSLEAESSAKGPNLGFYAIDQIEECTELSLHDIDARCRYSKIPHTAWRAYIVGNPAPGWCKRTFYLRHGSIKDFKYWGSKTDDLTEILGDSYIKRIKANNPKWWVDRYVYGGWGTREGQVLHKFKNGETTITREEFNKRFRKDWPVIASYDHGSNSSHPCAILYMTWNPEEPNTFYIFTGAKKNENVDGFAKVIKGLEQEMPYNPILRRVADIDTFGQRGIGVPADAYREQGISFIKCNKKPHYLNEAIATANQLLAEKKIVVVDDLLDVIDEFEGWEYKEKSSGMLDAEPAKVNDDYCKSLLYLILEIQIEFAEDDRAESHRIIKYPAEYEAQLIEEMCMDTEMGW